MIPATRGDLIAVRINGSATWKVGTVESVTLDGWAQAWTKIGASSVSVLNQRRDHWKIIEAYRVDMPAATAALRAHGPDFPSGREIVALLEPYLRLHPLNIPCA